MCIRDSLWTDRLELSDTWEDVQLLYVPVLDSTGKVRGLCGMEMSNLYFRLSYPMVEGSCGNIVTVLAPMDKKGNISLDKAMFGDTKETYLSPSGTMTVKKGKHYNTYSTAFGNYIGRHEPVSYTHLDAFWCLWSVGCLWHRLLSESALLENIFKRYDSCIMPSVCFDH